MRGSKIVEDAARGVTRAVINRYHLEMRIVELHECSESAGKFFFLVARAKENRDSRAIGIRRGRKILHPGKSKRAVSDAESVSEPEKCDGSKEKDSEKMHGDWCRMQASGYPSTRWGEA